MLRPGDVRPGKCFASGTDGGVRRVLTVRNGLVTFESRGETPSRKGWPGRSEASLDVFLAEAAMEVGCDYVAGRSETFLFA